jgi:hypothetical protein
VFFIVTHNSLIHFVSTVCQLHQYPFVSLIIFLFIFLALLHTLLTGRGGGNTDILGNPGGDVNSCKAAGIKSKRLG